MKIVCLLMFLIVSQLAQANCISFGMRPGHDDPSKACFEIEKDPSGVLQVRRVRLYTMKGVLEVIELDSVYQSVQWRGRTALSYYKITGTGQNHRIYASQSYNDDSVHGVRVTNINDNYSQTDVSQRIPPPQRGCVPGRRCI